jgi:UDP-N-acetylglucosamine--N-acetylmuramyl-(pentapeptide) pyrophosphoryl-undecaprenol N-acetylglucosamine transferase
MRVLLACERSGGHIFPALSVAKSLEEKEIYFFATSDFLRNYLAQEGFKVYGRCFSSRNIFFELSWRALEAVYLIFKLRPQKIIGFGGRDSFFLLFFGSLFFLDTAIYELNFTFGKANTILSFFVRRIFCGFPKKSADKKIKAIGIPLRRNIKIIKKQEALRALGFSVKPAIFCFGGSQGSSFLNASFMKLIENLKGDYQIIHLTGKREYFQILQLYNKIEKNKFIRDFYWAIEVLYSAADIVICRAGASTLSEVAYYALPALIIPHPSGGGHQKENAFYLEERGAAYILEQEKFSFDIFKGKVERLLYDSAERERLRNNLSTIKLGVAFEEFRHTNHF